ncbi:hypothetical protein WS52_19000 [Burkholderia territorii]|nr:hypothetical protein WS52_19000 [Burkholderia territorii]KUZ57988.1 hypothetical protein WS53_11000 [Burkholderia territorii]
MMADIIEADDLLTWYTSLQSTVHGMGQCIDLLRMNPSYDDIATMIGVFHRHLDHLLIDGFSNVTEKLPRKTFVNESPVGQTMNGDAA